LLWRAAERPYVGIGKSGLNCRKPALGHNLDVPFSHLENYVVYATTDGCYGRVSVGDTTTDLEQEL